MTPTRFAVAAGTAGVIAALVAAPLSASATADQPEAVRPASAGLANPLVPGTYPGAVAGGPVVLEFSNESYTDTSEEDWDIATVLLEISSELTVTDGADGSAGAWTTALDGVDVLVLPEGDNWTTGGSSAISDPALEVIRSWTEAGGTIVGTGSYTHAAIVGELTGVDYSDIFDNNDEGGPWARQIADERLPATVPNGNWTGGLPGWSTWTAEQKAPVSPIYLSTESDNVAMASFAIGEGAYVYIAYDWYPDGDELTNGVRATWNQVLRFGASSAVDAPPAAPTKALEVELQVQIGERLAGGPIAVSAEGLKADAPWTLELHSDPIRLGDGIVPDSGVVSSTVTLPSTLPTGWHRLVFDSVFADGTVASWERWIKIDAAGVLVGTSDTEPAPELAETGAADFAPAVSAAAVMLLVAGGALVALRRRLASR